MASNRFRMLAAAAALGTAGAGAAPCEAPEHRQFDFWVGEWSVYRPDGALAGTNRIEREYGGCVLHERYTGASRGYAGESLNTYDASRRMWHQTWVDNAGTLLLLDGDVVGGNMVMQGSGPHEGRSTQHRITWSPNADGTVRQLWEVLGTDGRWTVIFDGRYRRK